MQIGTILTYLLTFVAIAIATPLGPNTNHLAVQDVHDEQGNVVGELRGPGHFQDPVLFNAVFAEANRMLTCLLDALDKYSNKAYPQSKALLDKYYGIHDNPQLWDNVHNVITYLSTTNDLVILADEYGDGPESAFVSSAMIQGQQVWGIAFSKKFSNKSPAILAGQTPRLSLRAQAAFLLHEAIHALSGQGNHGDHVRIDENKHCTFFSAREFAALRQQYKDQNKPELRKQLFTVYWKEKCMSGWRKMLKYCPMQMTGVPDATAAAGYECLYRREGDLNKLMSLW